MDVGVVELEVRGRQRQNAHNQDDTIFSGLILFRPPRMWETRAGAAPLLLAHADQLRQDVLEDEEQHAAQQRDAAVLTASATTDLSFSRDDLARTIRDIPTLVLVFENDPVHPVLSTEAIPAVAPHAEVVISADEASAVKEWPAKAATFLEKIL